MKMFLVFLSLAISTSSAQAATNSVHGTYRSGSFLSSQSAELTIATSGNSVRASINAPGADCVVTFGVGKFAGNFPDRALFGSGTYDLYYLPVVNSCGGPVGFGAYRSLLINRDQSGNVTNVKIKGSNGKSSWTYFSEY